MFKMYVALASVLFSVSVATSSKAQTFTVLHTFDIPADGEGLDAPLVRDSAGNLYGTTYAGGTFGLGIVFKIDPNGSETILRTFAGGMNDGANPTAGLVLDSKGNLYGTTELGGQFGNGTAFRLAANGKEFLYSFSSRPDGELPYGGLFPDGKGNFYGTTQYGGSKSQGAVVKFDRMGRESVVYSFTAKPDGATPMDTPTVDAAGNIYGTTKRGGAYSLGTIFRIDPTGNETVLHSFGVSGDGFYPYAGLILDSAGTLYGTTFSGGLGGYGTVFKLDGNGTFTVLHSFSNNSSDGGYLYSGLARDSTGNLYGTTSMGGAYGLGTVFKIDPSGNETVLHSFQNTNDGACPSAGVIVDGSDILYGVSGVAPNQGNPGGVVFKITP